MNGSDTVACCTNNTCNVCTKTVTQTYILFELEAITLSPYFFYSVHFLYLPFPQICLIWVFIDLVLFPWFPLFTFSQFALDCENPPIHCLSSMWHGATWQKVCPISKLYTKLYWEMDAGVKFELLPCKNGFWSSQWSMAVDAKIVI